MTSLATGRVLLCSGGTYRVETPDGTLDCTLRGKVKQAEGDTIAVGDEVEVEVLPSGDCRIASVLPRHSKLARHSVARRREQVIAANVDRVVPVMSVRRPAPDYRMLDRLLVLAELDDLRSTIVLNKWDLIEVAGDASSSDGALAADADPSAGQLRDAIAHDPDLAPFVAYISAGYEVIAASAKTGVGLEALGQRLHDGISVLSGPSGAGKSSLLNALMPELDLRVGVVSEKKGRGRHTTVNASLHPLPGGGYVADTPGLQFLSLWEVDPAELAHAFPEFRSVLDGCHFANCRHIHEPSCAVLEAVEGGDISRSRYESYVSLLEEAVCR